MNTLTRWQIERARAEAERDFQAGRQNEARMASKRQRDRVYTREIGRLLDEQAEVQAYEWGDKAPREEASNEGDSGNV